MTGQDLDRPDRRVPTRKWYSRVVPSKHADGTVYVTQRGREDDDFGVYVYKSTDYGKTFVSLASNIPAGPVNVMREDPRNPNTLYRGYRFRRVRLDRRRAPVASARRRPAVSAGLRPRNFTLATTSSSSRRMDGECSSSMLSG